MDVRLPNGEIVTNVPDGMSKADLVAKLRASGRDLSWLEPPAAPAPVAAEPAPVEPPPQQAHGLSAVANIAGTIGEVGQDFGGFVKRSAARLVGGAAETPAAVARMAENSAETMFGVDLDAMGVPRIVSGSAEAAAAPVRKWAKSKEQEAVDALTPKARRALELSLVEKEEETGKLQLGEGASDPHWWMANVIDVGMQAVPGLTIGGASARMAYTARYRQVLGEMAGMKVPQSVALAKAEQEGLAAAKRAAMISGGLTEGIAAGGQNAAEVRAVVESLNEETLMAYPGYLELRDSGMSHEQARDEIAKDKAAAVAIATGAATAMTGAPMNAFFGELTAKFGRAAEPVTLAQRATTAAKGVAGEAGQEFVQEGADQLIQNKALQPITGVETWDNVLESAITGAVLGGVVGGGSGVVLGGKNKKPGEKTEETPSLQSDALSRAEAAYEEADAALKRGLETARDPKVPMKYADLQALRDARKQAMVNFIRELMHSGKIKGKDQAKIAGALQQAEQAGMPAESTATAGGEVSAKRDAALEAAANAEQLDESDANDLIARGYARVNPRGVMVLTPEGRRQRKAAQERAKEAAESSQVSTQPANKIEKTEQVAAKQRIAKRKPLTLSPTEAAKRKTTQLAETAIAVGEDERREGDRLKATVQAKVQQADQTAAEIEGAGFDTPNPQMRDAFRSAIDRARRARAGLPDTDTPKSTAGAAQDKNLFRIQNTISGEDRDVRVVRDGNGNIAIGDGDGGVIDITAMVKAGKSVEQAIAHHLTANGDPSDVIPARSTKRVAFRLKGAPESVEIPGQGRVKVEPVKQAKEAAASYRKRKGITTPEQTEFARVDPARAKRIAQAFEEMKHEPNNPVVKRAYRAMIDETKAQWDEIKKTGLKVEFIKPGQADPYAASPRLAIEDVRNNNHLWVFPTDSGFGTDSKYSKDNPMLEDAGETIDGHKLKNNDVFRIVHDYFGHVQEANGFRADGEENAWQIHARMYSPLARRAMTTETRGQNSWVNYGPYGEKNRSASSAETKYADQKIGLLPAEFSAFPGETLKFKHFSPATDDRIDLDPERMGTGAKGAEAKRGGPKVVSLYAEHGETEPDVANGRTRYNVEIPAEDLYNASTDPQGLLAQAQVPFGLTQDDKGNMVPVGHRFDMNKFEELVRDAGYLGYHLPEAQGILKGQARIFHTYPATRDGLVEPDRARSAARMKKRTSEEQVRKFLTPEENARLKKASARKLIEVFDELPDGAELAAAAVAGQAKRGWYRRSSEALVNVFGPDAPRFAALLAALSPQTSVEWNFRNAVAVWVGWDKAGRPTDRKTILFLMREHLYPGTNKAGKSKVLGAWVNNTVRALSAEDPSSVTLSGPKVDSFAANLRGETERVTLDAWMANWAGVNQTLFKGELKPSGVDPGLRPGYLAFSARVREAAQILSERTGETWTPAEVQETVWSWAKTLYEQAESFGALATARELVDNNELTDELINATPDFAGLFEDPEIASILSGTIYGPRAARSDGKAAAAGRAGRKAPAAAQDARHLRRAADRLDALRKSRKEAETRAESAAAMKAQTETPEFKRWFGNSKVVNPDGSPMVVYHGTNASFSSFGGLSWFTSSAKLSDIYAEFGGAARGQAPSVMPVYLSIQYPLVLPFDMNDTAEVAIAFARENGIDGIVGGRLAFDVVTQKRFIDAVADRGFDGIRVSEQGKETFAAFYPRQIKSAIGNRGAFDPNNPDITARMGSGSPRGIPAADLQAVADRVTRELGVTANIANTQADLPDYIAVNIPEGAVVTGMFVEDPISGETEIWYVRENLDSVDEAYENALHEAVGHMGLRAVLGSSYHKVMQDIRKSFPEKVAWAERQNGIDVMLREARARKDFAAVRRLESLAAEELVAYAAGKVLQKRGALSQQSVWRRIVATVRDILRNVGLLNSYSGEDIEALIYRARDFFRKPARVRAQEIEYRAKLAAAVKAQPADAPQWLDPSEYLSEDTKSIRERLDAARMPPGEFAEDDLNPAPERESELPVPGAVEPQVVFAPNFSNALSGEADIGDDFTEVAAYADGKQIGYVTISAENVSGREDEEGWSPDYVYVDPAYRGKGVAQAMYKAISDKLGVPAQPSENQTELGARMWDSFKRRKVAFRLKEKVKKQTNSAAFKKWFGDSKVVDADGSPKVLYHGTFGDFDAFNNASDDSYVGPGFYFTDNPDDASGYALLDHPDVRAKTGAALDVVKGEIPYQSAMMELETSDDPDAAIEAAEEHAIAEARRRLGHRTEGSVVPVFMRMENPFIVHHSFRLDFLEPDGPGADLLSVLRETDGATDTVAHLERQGELDGASTLAALRNMLLHTDDGVESLPDLLRAAGFDGIIDREAALRWSGFTPSGAVHYIVWDNNQIKSAVGNAGTFSRKDPRIAFAFKQGPTGNSDLDAFIKKIGQPPQTLRQRWQEFKANFRERAIVAIADPFYGIKSALETAGADLDAYMGARLSRNAAELTQTIIEYGPPVWNGGAPDVGQGMGLLDILKPLKGNVNLWLAYMTAQRANRLMTEGRERLFTQQEIDAALDLARTHPEFDIARQQYNKLQKQVLDFAEAAGVIDPQTRSLWEHADYIPFHRIIDQGQVIVPATAGGGLGKVRDQIRRLKGGKQNIGDPLENIVRNWSSLMDASLKAQAAREIVDALNGTGLVTKRGTIHPSAILPITAAAQFSQQNPQLVAALQSIGINPAQLPPQAFAGLQKMLSNPKTGENVVNIWRAGKREQWDVHDPLLMMGLQEVNPDALSPLIRGLVKLGSYPKRLVTRMITATPQFMVKNFWRDVWHTTVLGSKTAGARLDVLPTDSIMGLTSTLKNDATAKSLLAAGGSFTHGYVNAADLEGAATVIRRSIRAGQTKGMVLDSMSKIFRFYGDLQAAAENANRVAMYREGLKKGLTRRQAAFAARDLLDFSQRGQNGVMRFLIATVPFFNARVQGLYRIGHGMKSAFWAIALRGLLMTLAASALLARNYDDERYKALTDQEKSNYWHFFNVFEEGDHFRLPKPFEIGTIFGTIPEAIGDAMFTNSEDPDGTLQAAKYVGYAFEETLSLAPHPQLIWPMVELAINKNTFTGAPVLTQGDEQVLPEDQRGPGTSPTYAALAGLMPEVAPEALRSPKQLEHLGRGYLGNLQDYALMATDAAVRLARGEPAPPQKATTDIPGVKDFYRTGPARNTRHTTAMYELAEQAAKVQASILRAEKQETAEGDARVEELERDHADILEVADDFKDAAQQVIDLKKEQREIQLDPDMTPDEKRTEIDALQQEINDIARDVYDLRPGGKLHPGTAAELLSAPPSARADILRKNNMPATADLLEQVA